ncbi:hypothetical protein GCM10010294_68800 [Streptomyces griseoloalbus]|nr:hypothetical protein GCM10010294_68800 [Streptomyces griseoloalbus]
MEGVKGVTWTPPAPMLTTPTPRPDLPPGCAAEAKWDGYRAQLAVYTDTRVLLRSRQGTDLTASFPEIRAAALTQLPPGTALDGVMRPDDVSHSPDVSRVLPPPAPGRFGQSPGTPRRDPPADMQAPTIESGAAHCPPPTPLRARRVMLACTPVTPASPPPSPLAAVASRVVASRVAVVTALDGSRPHGTTVSAFASLSLAPPMALVSLDERSRLLAIIRRSGRFGLNVLGAHQADPASLFARSGPAVQRMAAKRGAGAAAGWAAPALTPQEARRCSSYGNQVV